MPVELEDSNLPKLSNKRCPLICIKDQTMPISIFQQVRESGIRPKALKLSSMIRLYGYIVK